MWLLFTLHPVFSLGRQGSLPLYYVGLAIQNFLYPPVGLLWPEERHKLVKEHSFSSIPWVEVQVGNEAIWGFLDTLFGPKTMVWGVKLHSDPSLNIFGISLEIRFYQRGLCRNLWGFDPSEHLITPKQGLQEESDCFILSKRVSWGGAYGLILEGRNVWFPLILTSQKYEERAENEVGRVKISQMTDPGNLEENTRKKGLCNF